MPGRCSKNEKAKKFYVLLPEKEFGKKMYRCSIANCLRIVNGKNPFSLVSHIRSKHIDSYIAHIDREQMDPKLIALTRLKFIQNCTEVVTINGRPFRNLQDTGIRGLIEGNMNLFKENYCKVDLDNGFTEIKSYIMEVASKIEDKIRNEAKDQFPSFMVDIANRNGRGFLSIYMRYVIDGSIVERCLGILHINSRHTSAHVKKMILERMNHFAIEKIQVIGMATDNAANMKAMVKLFNDDIGVEIENANEIENGISSNTEHCSPQHVNSVYNFDEIRELIHQYDNEYDHDAELHDLLDDENVFEEILKDIELDFNKTTLYINGVPCLAHSLQLAVNDAFKDSFVQTIIDLCRTAAKMLRREAYVFDLQEVGIRYKVIRLDSKVRWNSIYRMVILQNFYYLDFASHIIFFFSLKISSNVCQQLNIALKY